MFKKKNSLIIVSILTIILMLAVGSYAYWTWKSEEDKNIVFNTSKQLQDYIIYDEGESKFVGDFKISSTYLDGVHTTVSIYKTEEAKNIEMYATINMRINGIGENLKDFSGLKWTLTKGNATSNGQVLASGNFLGYNINDTIELKTNIEVLTELKEYTVWLWLDSAENPDASLTGEKIDTSIWTQVNQLRDETFEILSILSDNNTIKAKVVNKGAKITHYQITTENIEPTGWIEIASDKIDNAYTLEYLGASIGTNYVWFKDENGKVISKSVIVSSIYQITYKLNGGTHGDNPPTEYESGIETTLVAPTKEKYSFDGWYLSEDFSGTAISKIPSTQIGDIVLYAKWIDNTPPVITLSKETYIAGIKSPTLASGHTLSSNGILTMTAKGDTTTDYYYVGSDPWYITFDGYTTTASTNHDNAVGSAGPGDGGIYLGSSYYDANYAPTKAQNGYSDNGNAPQLPLNTWSNDFKWNGYNGYGASVKYLKVAFKTGYVYSQPTVKIRNFKVHGQMYSHFYDITQTASDEESGIKVVKYALGNQNAEYFKNNGTILTSNTFTVTENGTYTVYASDNAGNETVKTIVIDKIDKDGPYGRVNLSLNNGVYTVSLSDYGDEISGLTPTYGFALINSGSCASASYTNQTGTSKTYSGSYTSGTTYYGCIKLTDNVGNVSYISSSGIKYNKVSDSYKCNNTSSGSSPYLLTYSGNCIITNNGGMNFKVQFLTSGTLNIKYNTTIDAFLVGGGGGGSGSNGLGGCNAGYGGGGGGYTATHKSLSLTGNTNYSIVIGAGGTSGNSGGTTSAFGKSISGGASGKPTICGDLIFINGQGGAGGSGGGGAGGESTNAGAGGSNGGGGSNGQLSFWHNYWRYSTSTGGGGQGTTTREFGESSGTLYSGGGGGSNNTDTSKSAAGGSGGGGTGRSSGTANTGGGGGGGASGGSGIVIIRSSSVNDSQSTLVLTYNNNGGSGCHSKSITNGFTYGELCTPKRAGYTFDGWYTAVSGGTKIISSTTVSTTSNQTLYAHWSLGPAISIDPVRNSAYVSGSISSKITVTKGTNDLDPSSYKYIWSTDKSATPTESFISGNSYTLSDTTGIYYLVVTACDINGNCTTNNSEAFYIDNSSPTGSVSATYGSNTISATLTVSDTGSGVKNTYGWKISTSNTCNASTTGFTNSSNRTYNFMISSSGTYYVCAKVTDNVGHVSYIVSSGISATYTNPMSNFSYTGTYDILENSNGNWTIRLKTSGTLKFGVPVIVDAFLVGGGGGGATSSTVGTCCQGGAGGGGGSKTTATKISLTANTSYSITIGSGGTSNNNGGTTSALGKTASGGTKGAGGRGGYVCGAKQGGWYDASSGSNGTYAFGSSSVDGILYGAGGGGAGCHNASNVVLASASGGTTGGGAGNESVFSGTGKAATANTGSGGGGGATNNNPWYQNGSIGGYGQALAGGSGGSGVVIIRSTR